MCDMLKRFTQTSHRQDKLEGKKLKTVRWDEEKRSLIYTTVSGEEIKLWYPVGSD